ncbi:Small heat shock protein HSP [Parasponia andersonii]|uniref:Small heat shock protein HSP n=1 Tax=Parasponia andersonii TaxID=3476 RepID=A0A2P5DC23_PARAD|nr:Small heat shock protein HSP [Parasponia andersonii]
MLIIPSFFHAQRNGGPLDLFVLDLWDPFKDLSSSLPTFFLDYSKERNAEKEDKNNTWHHVEHSGGKFMRWFRLPVNDKMDQVKAAIENGVLTVIVPKAEVEKPDIQTIEISG